MAAPGLSCAPPAPPAALTAGPLAAPPRADEVAWLFNLRGGDVPYNPVFLSYGLVTPDTAVLYVDAAKVTPECAGGGGGGGGAAARGAAAVGAAG